MLFRSHRDQEPLGPPCQRQKMAEFDQATVKVEPNNVGVAAEAGRVPEEVGGAGPGNAQANGPDCCVSNIGCSLSIFL